MNETQPSAAVDAATARAITGIDRAVTIVRQHLINNGCTIPVQVIRDALEAATPTLIADYEVTLGTLREQVRKAIELDDAVGPSSSAHARGYTKALRNVKAILDMHGAPPDQPVVFGEPG